MRSVRVFLLVGGLFIFSFFSLVYAQGLLLINYQGKLTTPGGALMDTTVQMVFSMYNSPTSEIEFWTETHPAVEVEKGVFSVVLGSVNPIEHNDLYVCALWGNPPYMGVKVGTDPEMTPRKQIVSSAFAITDGDWERVEDDLFYVFGGVGIGNAHEHLRGLLEVGGDSLCAGYFTSDYLSSNTHVIHSEFTGTENYDARAVYGYSRGADNYGIGAEFEGGYKGVIGTVYSEGGEDPVAGVVGDASGGSTKKYGVQGQASGSGTNYGVYGYASGTGTNWAGYFYGNAMVTGTLTKGGGSFQIDHPLDPENKYLFHSFVESPDMMNVYNGNVILDANGEATVQLPAYFEALNKDFRYQLTCIGGFAPVYIAQKISGNQFTIAGGEPGMEVSWQVTGIRHDKFAEANRIQVEVDKPADEQGKYLHPQAYNLGEEYDIHYEQNKRTEERDQRKME